MNENHYTNKLINESSPYLLQHAYNPVHWYPWGEEALEKARNENKLILVSIGYAACHWCHVMAHESFEDPAVAEVMNERYISVKVDREERPDVDQVYMNAIQLLTGSGGWPLNIIALPDGRPVYGGTYFPKDRWIEVLKLVSDFVRNNPQKAEEQAENLTAGVRSEDHIPLTEYPTVFSIEDLRNTFNNWKKSFDTVNGGYKGAPKFPLPAGYLYLLQYHYMTGEEDALKAVKNTLDKMAFGGIYDQLGGGFSRYSTDAFWRVPHFEKMLYDNSQLVSLYAAAYQSTGIPLYKKVVFETIEFVERELTSSEGGFYSSIDADSDGEEGNYYIWTKEEFEKIAGNDATIVLEYFNITSDGNWEKGKNICFRTASDSEIALKHNITENALSEILTSAKTKLFYARSRRRRPATDDKILAGWNSLMMKAYTDAYKVFGEKSFLDRSLMNGSFILENMKQSDGRLQRSYRKRKTSVNGYLDDYAFTIEAFISLYQSTFNENWLREAANLSEYTITHFFDPLTGMFYYTSDLDPPLIARKTEINDNVIPSANSSMAKNLFLLGTYFNNDEYLKMSRSMASMVKQHALSGGAYYGNWDTLISWIVNPPCEVAIVGDAYESYRREFDRYYLPNVLFSGGQSDNSLSLLANKLVPGQTTIYICRNKTCNLPVTEVSEALIQIEAFKVELTT